VIFSSFPHFSPTVVEPVLGGYLILSNPRVLSFWTILESKEFLVPRRLSDF
jgi:hypothetical protein